MDIAKGYPHNSASLVVDHIDPSYLIVHRVSLRIPLSQHKINSKAMTSVKRLCTQVKPWGQLDLTFSQCSTFCKKKQCHKRTEQSKKILRINEREGVAENEILNPTRLLIRRLRVIPTTGKGSKSPRAKLPDKNGVKCKLTRAEWALNAKHLWRELNTL